MTSAHNSVPEEPTDLLGLDVYHNDRNLGAVEEVREHGGRQYLVVDTRHWTFGNRRIVPAELVGTDIAHHDRRRVVRSPAADPNHIRDAPDFDPFRLADKGYWAAIDRHYDHVETEPPTDG